MAAYKDEKRGTKYVSLHYYDWIGKNCRKVKSGFKTSGKRQNGNTISA